MLQLMIGVMAFFLCIHSLMYGYMNSAGLLTSFAITVFCYLPHELAHISFGGRYRISPFWTVLSLLATYFRFPFILVGYVEFKDTTNIVAKASAGIIANIIIAIASLMTSFFYPSTAILVYPSLVFAWSNSLPLMPLDGSYIFEKSRAGWSLMFLILTLSIVLLR